MNNPKEGREISQTFSHYSTRCKLELQIYLWDKLSDFSAKSWFGKLQVSPLVSQLFSDKEIYKYLVKDTSMKGILKSMDERFFIPIISPLLCHIPCSGMGCFDPIVKLLNYMLPANLLGEQCPKAQSLFINCFDNNEWHPIFSDPSGNASMYICVCLCMCVYMYIYKCLNILMKC
jgi:hypothetical protein